MIQIKSLKLTLLVGLLFISSSAIATTSNLSLKEQAIQAYKQRDYQHANLHYRRALRETPQDIELLIGIAQTEEILGRTAVAVTFALKAKKIDSENIHVYLLLGRLYASQKKWIDARIAYQVARLLDPNNSSAMIGLGQAIENIGDDEGANDQYKAFDAQQKAIKKNYIQ